ncbi:Exocyst complex component EXO70B1 [Spatholobus suberectus]|nr:Exocyst complex component EXO70B1 [Spatholobus suberectus]
MAQEADSPPENEDQRFLVGSHSQQVNSDSDNSIMAQFLGCIEALKKENGNIIDTVLKHVDEYLKANVVHKEQIAVLQLHRDDNLVVDSLPLGIINNLRESIRLMMTAGLEEECLHVYSICRREFLNSERVFEGFIRDEDNYPALPGIGALRLWKNPALPEIDAVRLWKSLSIDPALVRINASRSEYLLYLTYGVKEQVIVPDGRIHRISHNVFEYIHILYRNWKGLFDAIVNKEGKFLLYGHIAEIADLLDSSLEDISENYNDPTLGYVFIINNRKFIELSAEQRGSRTSFALTLMNILLFNLVSIFIAYEFSASALNNSRAKIICLECDWFDRFLPILEWSSFLELIDRSPD